MPSPRPSGNPARPRRTSSKAPATVHQLKVTLRYTHPPIWRRVQVSSDASLATVHQVLQRLFGWEDDHLHEFEAGGRRFGRPQPDDGWGDDARVEDERRVTLGRVASRKDARLLYRYDFGDDWLHDIVVEEILPADPAIRVPRCLDGRRAAPPEDCGGPPGYADLLDALADPGREDHAERREWVGDGFDPEAFDLVATNRALARVR